MENNEKGKFMSIVKRYGYYALAFVLILGITLSVVFTSTKKSNTNTDIPTDTQPIVFGLPISSPSVLKWYSDTELMYNETLKQWESHKGIDLISTSLDNLDVLAVLDGVVASVETNYEYGTCITINHTGGFVSKYYSLADDVSVQATDKVSKGSKIGTISQSGANESKVGNHLHFELYKDNQKVDPANYLSLENK